MNHTPIRRPKLTLVGAGPGDPELLTIKGLKALEQADVVLYDALANEELLNHAPQHAIKQYVGKRAGQHSTSQADINQMGVDFALRYGHVVHLKGGDPFVFGRGMEQVLYAHAFGVETQVIPGISSSVAVPALQNIPLTHRNVSDGFWVITATKSDQSLSSDIRLAAQSNATVVVLMGMGKLAQIASIYQQVDKGTLPIAVIQNGTLSNEQIAVGSIDTIVELSKQEGLGTPAILVIGEVVRLREATALATHVHELVDTWNHR